MIANNSTLQVTKVSYRTIGRQYYFVQQSSPSEQPHGSKQRTSRPHQVGLYASPAAATDNQLTLTFSSNLCLTVLHRLHLIARCRQEKFISLINQSINQNAFIAPYVASESEAHGTHGKKQLSIKINAI